MTDLSVVGDLRQERIPLALIEPLGVEGGNPAIVKALVNNFSRAEWAACGKALSRFELKKLQEVVRDVAQQLVTMDKIEATYHDRLFLVHQFNTLFLRCKCIEDSQVLANAAIFSSKGLIEALISIIVSGEPLLHLGIQALANLAVAGSGAGGLEARREMVVAEVFPVLFSVMSESEEEVVWEALRLLDLLTDNSIGDSRSDGSVAGSGTGAVSAWGGQVQGSAAVRDRSYLGRSRGLHVLFQLLSRCCAFTPTLSRRGSTRGGVEGEEAAGGAGPLSADCRMLVLRLLERVVDVRECRQRVINIQWGDVFRRIRDLDDVQQEELRLMRDIQRQVRLWERM